MTTTPQGVALTGELLCQAFGAVFAPSPWLDEAPTWAEFSPDQQERYSRAAQWLSAALRPQGVEAGDVEWLESLRVDNPEDNPFFRKENARIDRILSALRAQQQGDGWRKP